MPKIITGSRLNKHHFNFKNFGFSISGCSDNNEGIIKILLMAMFFLLEFSLSHNRGYGKIY